MTTQQDIARGAAMIHECNDAAALFSGGLEAARAIRTDYIDAVNVMSLLAVGAEKMLKLTIGLAARDQGDPWPSKPDMREIGHQVLKADQQARPLLDRHPGTALGWLDDLKATVAQNPVLPKLLRALDLFGDAGRFYYLDLLAAAPQPGDSPQALWTAMTADIAGADPTLLADLTSAEHADRGRRRINDTIVDALSEWWDLYASAWRTGAIGEEAKRYARELTLPAPRDNWTGR